MEVEKLRGWVSRLTGWGKEAVVVGLICIRERDGGN